MSDSVFDANEIAAVIADASCLNDRGDEHCFRLRHPECAAAAIVAWLDSRLTRVPGEMNTYWHVQPEDQK